MIESVISEVFIVAYCAIEYDFPLDGKSTASVKYLLRCSTRTLPFVAGVVVKAVNVGVAVHVPLYVPLP